MAPYSLRRLRQNRWTRELSREVQLSSDAFIQPYFVVEGINAPEAIPGLTGNQRESPDSLPGRIEADLEKGVRKFLLFGVPKEKQTEGFRYDFTASQIEGLKRRFGHDLWLSVDVCLCSYTSHGQCGVLNAEGNHVENEATVEELAGAALLYAQAGADCVAPSDMMDGRIGAIRSRLDGHSCEQTLIMSYSAKFHSSFYGPFRNAADSAPKGSGGLRDRATYQIDPARPSDALLSSLRDEDEGADILMVKPGLPYLDVIRELTLTIRRPWAVYEVSGEFAAIEVLAQQGLIKGPAAHREAWIALRRAGASMIISYGARNARQWLEEERSS